MALLSSGAAGILRPEEIGELVVQPVQRQSVAMQVSTVVPTMSASFRIPIITADSSAAWTPEGEEITPTNPGVDELDIVPKKLAALTIISNELANDSSPEAQQVVGDSIARDIARKVDAAYFVNTTLNGPDGIASVAGAQLVDGGGAYTNTDPFAEALSKAEVVGANITAWVAHPDTVLTLSKLKIGTGYNLPLFGPDVSVPTGRSILGRPLYWAPTVAEGVVWGIPQDRAYVILRNDVDLVVDQSAYFSKDSVGIRATMRIGFGWPHEQAVVKVAAGGS
ncbi:MAG: phage major capsid protein [Mycolicibacterium sp.]|uniref:phage major capsid protein n=1 Tax=Mycolicibacterium sp. TaxID=2320850 RepID=UPI000FC1E036|nr:phage major capsid protein [Mycolicibacterium sp.]RUP35020.1 MAG: phage major capsid protein [Mycolicibacterium sp.]